MDLSTTYLGLKLQHPIMPGSSPLADDLDTVKRLEDAGAPAIVMHSLFQEQIEREALGTLRAVEAAAEMNPEAPEYFPLAHEFSLGPDPYLEHIRKLRRAVKIPVIASLNGTTNEGWLKHAKLIEQAGATALELNVYRMATDSKETGAAVEQRVLDIVKTVTQSVQIPVAVKLLPFYSSMVNMAARLDEVEADGLILFNRVYQPEIDAELLEFAPMIQLTHSSELPLRLRWLAVLSGRVKASLAASGGVHAPLDVVKAIMAGAHAVQMVSALLQKGPLYIREVREGLVQWMEEHHYDSVQQMLGSMSLQRCPDPSAFERGNYARMLQSWRS
ncbi:MAG: dihydroorotate dehydrogenase-like protein [Planctomycetota bacterium]